MSKVKIFFADHTPFAGGAQLCLARDLEYLDRQKFDPILVLDKAAKTSIYQKSNVPIKKISFPKLKLTSPTVLKSLISSVGQFQKLIIQEKPQIIVCNTTRTLIVAALAKKIFGLKFCLISYIRDYDYPKWIFRFLGGQVNLYLFVSQSVQSFYQLKGQVIYLGSDISRRAKVKVRGFSPTSLSLRGVEAVRGKKREFVVGYVGRLVGWKGPLWFEQTLEKLNDPAIKLILYGTGQGQAGDIEQKLKDYVKKHNLNVEFAGFQPSQTLIYKSIDCFVLPSLKSEPFATNVIEAAFTKLPIVATNTGGTPEFIKHQKNGLLVDPNDTNQLSLALLRLKQDPKLAQKLANQAYQDAQKFAESVFIKTLEKELLKCVSH